MDRTTPASRAHRLLTACLLGLVLVAPAARAEAAAGQTQGACATDTDKFCGAVKPGGGARLKCLMEHEKDLTPGCKAQVEQVKAHAQEVAEACSDDAEKLCKGVEPGQGRVVKCLAEHESALTPDCKAEVDKGQQKRAEVQKQVEEKKHAVQEACGPDIVNHCAKVEKGEGRIVKCLHDHQSELAPACKSALP
jgi:hypothetical protein